MREFKTWVVEVETLTADRKMYREVVGFWFGNRLVIFEISTWNLLDFVTLFLGRWTENCCGYVFKCVNFNFGFKVRKQSLSFVLKFYNNKLNDQISLYERVKKCKHLQD